MSEEEKQFKEELKKRYRTHLNSCQEIIDRIKQINIDDVVTQDISDKLNNEIYSLGLESEYLRKVSFSL